jgi:hypothetical protein
MRLIRYIDGKRIDKGDLSKYVIESDIVPRTIKTVNDRLSSKVQGDGAVL